LLYNGPLLCGFDVSIEELKAVFLRDCLYDFPASLLLSIGSSLPGWYQQWPVVLAEQLV